MADTTGISWTDSTWSVFTGCSRKSEGCRHCYSEALTGTRLRHLPKYAGLTRDTAQGPRFTGEVRFNEAELTVPLRWRKPRMVFVNSMSDTFHESVKDEWIDRLFAVMAVCPQHTFQVLTKRPERMAEYFSNGMDRWCKVVEAVSSIEGMFTSAEWLAIRQHRHKTNTVPRVHEWPRGNIWLGCSVENQAAADERIPHLLRTPAAVRFLSIEPLLGPVDLRNPFYGLFPEVLRSLDTYDMPGGEPDDFTWAPSPRIDWVIVGGESGPGARPCDVEWIRSIVRQCREAGTPVFVKQLGSATLRYGTWIIRDPKGGDPSEWPEDLRVQEFPHTKGDTP